MRNMFDEVRANKIRSVILLVFFFILIAAIGAVSGQVYGDIYFGLIIASIVTTIYILISWFSGDKMILSMSGAKPVTKKEHPHLYHTIEGIALAAGLPTPKAYVIEDNSLNAFATGRSPDSAAITVTTGLLKKLNRQELEGVVAHEMSHIKNYDIRFMMLVAVLLGAVVMMSHIMLRSLFYGGGRSRGRSSGGLMIIIGILLAILAPIFAQMIRFAVSRKREYLADANGALLTRYPKGLANALRKISNDTDVLDKKTSKSMAHLFISNPFKKEKSGKESFFATHPPISERIKRLEQM